MTSTWATRAKKSRSPGSSDRARRARRSAQSVPAVTEVDTDAVATAVMACPHVAGLSAGTVEEVATYLPGRRVQGIRVRDEAVEIHIVARWGPPLPEVATEVRQAVSGLAGGRPIMVSIEDVVLPELGAPRE